MTVTHSLTIPAQVGPLQAMSEQMPTAKYLIGHIMWSGHHLGKLALRDSSTVREMPFHMQYSKILRLMLIGWTVEGDV